MDLRYPIGRLTWPQAAGPDARKLWIRQIAELPEALSDAVQGLVDSQLDEAYRPGGWTVRQVVHHVADSHVNAYIRFRWALTRDADPIKTYREKDWAQLADARSAKVELSLSLVRALHCRWQVLLESMEARDFELTLVHPEDGTLTLERLLATYAWHGRHHVAHIASLRDRRGWW